MVEWRSLSGVSRSSIVGCRLSAVGCRLSVVSRRWSVVPMNILHVVQLYYPVASGAARYFAEIGERLAHEGHRVTVLATDAYDLEHFWAPGRRRVERSDEIHNGVRILRLPVRRQPGPALLYPLIRRLMVEISRLPGT